MPEIIDSDQQSLRRLCYLRDDEPIPTDIEELYWQARRLTNRLGTCGPLSATTFVAIGLAAGVGHLQPKDVPVETFATLVQRGEVKTGEKIGVRWRNREREAEFIKIQPDGKVQFQLEDERKPFACDVKNAWPLTKEAVA